MVSGPSSQTKAFLDSSVLFAAVVSETGASRALFHEAFRGRCELLFTNYVQEEVTRNLSLKAPRTSARIQDLIAVARFVELPSEEAVSTVAALVEPKDAPIVAAALHAKADYVVTYDRRHLLAQAALIQSEFGLAVTSPGDLLGVLRQQS